MEISYSDETSMETGVYSVQASVDGEVLTVSLLGAGEQGEVHCEGRLRLPVSAVADVHLVLRKVFDGLRQLDLELPDQRSTQYRNLPANNGQPWTDEADRRLVEDWMLLSPDVRASEQIQELARVRERTAGSIRSRLIRLGCDPDHPGARLLQKPGDVDDDEAATP